MQPRGKNLKETVHHVNSHTSVCAICGKRVASCKHCSVEEIFDLITEEIGLDGEPIVAFDMSENEF